MNIPAFSKTYDDTVVLKIPDLELKPDKIYCIIGANGSGKSTFAKILAGVLQSDQKSAPLPSNVSIGYTPQKPYAFRMSTQSNILLGSNDKEKARHLMQALSLTHLANRRADRLSGGETARMSLARLMMRPCDLLLLDEPTASMDVTTTFLSEKLIQEYKKDHPCTMVIITHSLSQAHRLADEILFFYNGQLWEHGDKESLLKHPKRQETKEFLDFFRLS